MHTSSEMVEVRVKVPLEVREWLSSEGAKKGLTRSAFLRLDLIERHRRLTTPAVERVEARA